MRLEDSGSAVGGLVGVVSVASDLLGEFFSKLLRRQS